jgi:hypothetical protein
MPVLAWPAPPARASAAPRPFLVRFIQLDHLLEQAMAMENVIVRTFKEQAAVELARQELLAAGIPADGVEVTVRADETGAVQGNFTVGDDPSIKGKTAYSHTYAPTAQYDVRDCQITVTADDAAQAERAVAILDRLGALDPDPAHRRH